MFDTLPKSIEKIEDVKPGIKINWNVIIVSYSILKYFNLKGDLVFISATYYNPKSIKY
jgi:hypothetical protein